MPPWTSLTPRVPWPSEWGQDPGEGARQCPQGAGIGTLPTFVSLCPPCPLLAIPRRLLQQLEVAKCSKATPGKGPARDPAPAGDTVTFELYWRPEQEQFAQSAKVRGALVAPQGCPVGGGHCCPSTSPQTSQVSELEKRLAQLEAAMRCEPDSQVSSQVRGHCPAPLLTLC